MCEKFNNSVPKRSPKLSATSEHANDSQPPQPLHGNPDAYPARELPPISRHRPRSAPTVATRTPDAGKLATHGPLTSPRQLIHATVASDQRCPPFSRK